MKQIIRDYLTFNKRERNGVFVLLVIITLMIIYLNVSDKFVKKEHADFSKFEKQIDSVNAAVKAGNDSLNISGSQNYIAGSSKETKKAHSEERFDFDPNNLPDEDWKRLGFSEKQIKTIKNYESKGGTFRKKEDVKKMYCIKENQYNSLEAYIKIPAKEKAADRLPPSKIAVPAPAKTAVSAAVLIELNAADSASLTTIKGIGPFFAKTIIKYRNSLGGFFMKEQLMEVWKFDQEKFNAVEKYISVDPSKIKKININTCEAEQLKNPYLKWNQANAIVNYRKQHGKFKTIDEIKKTNLVDDETLRKIAPYLILE